MNLRSLLFLCIVCSTGLAHAAECPRIVSQSPYISHALDWLGLGKCIVGASRYDKLAVTRTGGVIDPDAKAIADLKPDLVIFSEWTGAAAAQAATPAGAAALRVSGFKGMAGVEAMLRDIGRAAGVADIDQRVAGFDAAWHAAAARTDSRQRRVLILSACGAAPYSYGKGTTLFELFSAAGFEVVADHDSIRNFKPGTADGDVAAWITERRPELLVALQDHSGATCNPAIAQPGIPILPLTGEYFTNPGPDFLKGLEELRQKMATFGS
ncbi:ABC transporter substrate-binding protein [Zoogloea sp. LCSB751]|uniref:ABC transporter substrate-binding protein n=1 Tax=Zoogloea sp. LCSB751 TaxID=1965277 RepID=UPI0009A4860D|nr:ABC transporter substrate-binding protein [Zoogloea sp. LCSB751]